MQAFDKDLATLCEEWDVWSVTSRDANKVVIQRSDEDENTVTITVPTTYPRGELVLVDVFNRRYVADNEVVGDALDSAIAAWCEDEQDDGGMGLGTGSSVIFDSNAAAGGVDVEIVTSVLQQAEAEVKRDLADARLEGHIHGYFNAARKKFIVRVAVPLNDVDHFRARSLSLDRRHVFVVELMWPWQYLRGTDVPEISDVFTCDRKLLANAEDGNVQHVGSLKWFITNRLRTAMTKNHVHKERRSKGFTEDDDADCEGLEKFQYSCPEEDFYGAGNENILFGIQQFVAYRISTCTSRCLICDDPLGFEGMKTGTCAKDLCHYSAESYGLGCDVVHELTHHGMVCELLIIATLNAAQVGARGRDVFTPMCPVSLKREAFPEYHGPTDFYTGSFGGTKNFTLLVATLQKLPSIPDMLKLAKGSNPTLRGALNKMDPLLFPTLQWILSSNRAHLEPIDKKHHITGMGEYQFHLVSSNPAKEARFRTRRATMQAEKGKGSTWVWHGSAPGNWHCILRSGLKNYSNTPLMSAGAAHGPGIYTAKTINTSLGYMGQATIKWDKATFIPHNQGIVAISLCELVNEAKDKSSVTGQPTLKDCGEIVTVQDEDLINTRFLFVFPESFSGNSGLKGESVSIPKQLLEASS